MPNVHSSHPVTVPDQRDKAFHIEQNSSAACRCAHFVLVNALLGLQPLSMPWAQRAASALHRLNVTWTPCIGGFRGIGVVPLHRRLPSACQGARTPALPRRQSFVKQATGRYSLGRQPAPLRAASGDTALDLVGPHTMSSSRGTDPDTQSLTDSTLDPADTAYRVVNFYHLVDIPNPYQART